jgi:hypothetical protein
VQGARDAHRCQGARTRTSRAPGLRSAAGRDLPAEPCGRPKTPRAPSSAQEAASKAGASKAFTPAEAKKVRSSYEKLQKEWGRRKLMLRERLAEYAEGTNKKIAVLVDELGLEFDEDTGIDATQFGVKVKWTR